MLACAAQGVSDIKLDCSYALTSSRDNREPKFALVHAAIQFEPQEESYLHVELTFRNAGRNSLANAHEVYIEFDDDAGRNYIRRPLPHVDLQEVAPGETKTFDDILLVPALRPRHYVLRLWIPSADPARKFDRSRNLLLSDVGVSEAKTALNRIGGIAIEP